MVRLGDSILIYFHTNFNLRNKPGKRLATINNSELKCVLLLLYLVNKIISTSV